MRQKIENIVTYYRIILFTTTNLAVVTGCGHGGSCSEDCSSKCSVSIIGKQKRTFKKSKSILVRRIERTRDI